MRKNQRLRISRRRASENVVRYAAEPLESRLLLAAQMVGDFAPGTPGSNPSAMINYNGSLFFIADDGVHGSELWKSDGTQAGTALVKDIQSGTVGALKGSWLTNFNGAIYFAADDGVNGHELWKSDGTAVGTVMVSDIYAGSASSNPGIGFGDDDRTRLVIGNTLYFRATDAKGDELWKTDGTRKGTVLVKDINTTTNSQGGSSPRQMTNLNGLLVFSAYDGGSTTLFRSDGTSAGTFTLNVPGQNISNPVEMTTIGGFVYFVNFDSITPGVLRRTDGTLVGTSIVTSVEGHLANFTNVNGTLFCVVLEFSGSAYDLYKFDAVAGQLKMIMPATGAAPQLPRNLTVLNGTLYLKGRNNGVWGLWKSDGTTVGTLLVKAVTPDAPADGAFDPYGNGFIFFGTDSANIEGLWESDGTPDGTTLIKAMDLPQPDYHNRGTVLGIGSIFYFTATTAGNNGLELWKTDGTPAGTALLKDINTAGFSFNPTAGGEAGGMAYFGANTYQLWRSDGTAAGTIYLGDSQPSNFLATSDSLYFAAYASGAGSKSLWRINGGGIVQLQPPVGGQAPTDLTNLNGTVYFAAQQITGPSRTLWKTDGTVAGTVNVSSVPGNPAGLVAMGNHIYFSASSDLGTELWTTDGTTVGTVLLKDILPGAASSNPRSLTVVGNTLYFLADGLQGATALWKSDGTAQGTTLVTSLTDTLASNFIAVNGLLLFLRSDANTGRELWESDGTPQGTKLLRDIVPGPGSSKISNLLVVGKTLFFQANDITHGAELWKTDGTEQGTQMVADIAPGLDASNPVPGINANGLLIFTANDSVHGTELWGSDGTAAGTSLLADINPGPAGSNPGGFTIANGMLFFGANDGVHGNELWKYPDIPQRLRAEANGPYNVSEGQSVTLSSFGSTGAIAAYEWDFDYDPAAGFVVDATGPSPSFAGLDGPSTHVVALRIRSATGDVSIDTAQVLVGNVAPTPGASGPQTIAAGAPYILQLAYADPGQDSPQAWKIEWGDGSVETFAGNPPTVSHTYNQLGFHSIYAKVTDDDGTYSIQTPGLTVGALDSAFNGNGIIGLPTFGNRNPFVADLQVLNNGKILVLGFDWNIWRFNADGSPDLTFGGGDGVIRPGIDAPVRTNTSTSAMVVQPDGKFIVAGTYSASGAPYYESEIVRFMPDGMIDPTFHQASFGDSMAFDVALQTDGKVLLCGRQSNKMLVARFDALGTLDQTFGFNGSVLLSFNSTNNTGLAIKQVSSNQIVVGGTSASRFALARLNLAGVPDPTFGVTGDGKVVTTFGSMDATNYAFMDDGRIVGVGHTYNSQNSGFLDVVRFNPDGSPDLSFKGTGLVQTVGGADTSASSVAVDSSGRIVVGGYLNYNFALFRYLREGQPDPDFASGGQMINTIPNIGGYSTRLALAPSGRIVASASSGNTDGTDFIMQFVQSPLSVQVLSAAPPVAADEVLIPSFPAGSGILTDKQPLLKPQKQTSLFSDQRIVQKPTIKTPLRRPVPAVREHV